jgi:alpha/beta superfamily hydrolase
MQLPARAQSLAQMVDGPAGPIEVLLAAPPGEARGYAVICHPHPLFGGAMSNKVVYTLASCALKAGLYALRFNFRGVGRSVGLHDEGRGETVDVQHLYRALAAQLPAQLPGVLAGFSFGAFIALRAAAALQPAALVSIAPPFGKYFGDAPPPPRPDCPWLVVHSRDDEVVAYAETQEVLEQYTPAPQLVSVDGAGHFFNGRLSQISEVVLPFLQQPLDVERR